MVNLGEHEYGVHRMTRAPTIMKPTLNLLTFTSVACISHYAYTIGSSLYIDIFVVKHGPVARAAVQTRIRSADG